ncbi:MAG: penicillin-binding protein 2 [Clostridia bacterium]|nr:penicillin-binding protein 2 [Clostridia bacterium]
MMIFAIILMFILVAVYFCYSVYFYGGRWVANPYNPRINNQKRYVRMGTVTDRTGVVLAYSEADGSRHYNNSAAIRKAVSQVIGDSGGKVSTGVDTFHAQYLLGFKASIFERLRDAITGTEQQGDNLELTISAELSRYITEQFPSGKRGAVVVMNYKTAEVLAMVSLPQFDPVHLEAALEDSEAGALMNRCTQGLYPPGSTFKIVTMISAIDNLQDLDDFAFDCTGYYPVGNYSVTETTAHGIQDLKSAFANSCNTTFAALSQQLGYKLIGDSAEQLGFNENFLFNDMIVYNSSYPADDLSPEDLAWSSIGQGRVLATPLHMALIACTIANQGIFKEPRLLHRIVTSGGSERMLPFAASDKSVVPYETALQLERDMIETVKKGTGTRAALSGYTVAGKTGSAEVSNDKSVEAHAWFVGYITDEKAPYAVCVLIENGGSGGRNAAPLARRALQKAINLQL